MPILANAKKALRKDRRRTVVNRRVKESMRLAIKAFKKAPDQTLLSSAYQKIDRSVKKNLLHRNKAARLKSQLARLLKSSSTKSSPKSKPAAKKPSPKKSPSKKPAAKK